MYEYWKRAISLGLCSLQCSWQETAALSGGNNSLPNIKLRRVAIAGFYATKNKGSMSGSFTLQALCYRQHSSVLLSSQPH